MRILGILGPAGAGKSTVAQYLVDHYCATEYSLASPLKNIATRVFDFSHAQCWGTQLDKETDDPRYGFSPRWLLQRLGTEGFRQEFGMDFWIDHLINRVRDERPFIAVVSDVRFINEARKILDVDGFVFRLESPGRDGVSTADASHQSEAEWSRAPYTTVVRPAVRGLAELYAAVDEVMFEHCALAPRVVQP
jgi:hypothetical protein